VNEDKGKREEGSWRLFSLYALITLAPNSVSGLLSKLYAGNKVLPCKRYFYIVHQRTSWFLHDVRPLHSGMRRLTE